MTSSGRKSILPIIEKLGARLSCSVEPSALTMSGISYDSRSTRAGDAFFCIVGQHFDGNRFVADAIKNGAVCVFTETEHPEARIPQIIVNDVRLALAVTSAEFYNNPSKKMRLIGVTGTNGKTTVTHLVEHVLLASGYKVGLIGTLGARVSGSLSYQDVKYTTPQAADLQSLLASMTEADCSYVSMEVSSHALAQKRVAGCHFAAACLTNITQDHLDFHKTMENYWKSKLLLFEELNQSIKPHKVAILNNDDPYSEQFAKVCGNSVEKITYGWTQEAAVFVKNAKFEAGITHLLLSSPAGMLDLTLKLAGRFNVYNTMAATAILVGEGLNIEKISTALSTFPGVSGRFEVVSSGNNPEPLCIVDYAHTPDGLDNLLKTAASIVPSNGKLIVVFGCGGDRDVSKRPQMGEIAESRADEVVITSDNPRTEDPQQILANILTGIKRMKNVKIEADRAQAIKLAIKQAGACDVVVVAGKGHENYQILARGIIPFDDRQEVLRALQERAGVVTP